MTVLCHETATGAGLSVLLVEDEPLLADAEEAVLVAAGHRVDHVESALEALQLGAHDVVVTDVHLPHLSGFDLVEALRGRGDASAVIFTSGAPTSDAYRRAMRLGAFEFLSKPFALDELARAVRAAAAAASDRGTPDRARGGRPTPFESRFGASPTEARDAVRALAAWLLEGGLGPAARMRVATACSEILSVPAPRGMDEGDRRLRARLEDGAVAVTLERSALPAEGGATTHELFVPAGAVARARALAESADVRPAGESTEIELRFERAPAVFAEERDSEFADRDYLEPTEVRHLLARAARRPAPRLPAGVASVLGRLLGAAAPERSPLRT